MCRALTDHEWAAIRPMPPNTPRGVRRVNDPRVLNGIFWGAAVRGAATAPYCPPGVRRPTQTSRTCW
jgi:transposase